MNIKRKLHMWKRDYRDIIGGMILIGLGLFTTFYTLDSYKLGTVSNMGAGMFPMALGVLLTGLGVLIMAPAFFRSGTPVAFAARPFFACLGSILLFALGIKYIGMVPAIMLLVMTATLADKTLDMKGRIILAALVTLLAVVIFTYGFGMTLVWFKWGGI